MYGSKIREIRMARGVSLRELGKMTLINYAELSRIETGQRVVSLPQAVVIAKALGVKVSEFVD